MDAAARAILPGNLVTLCNAGGDGFATAFFNPHTLVVGRVIASTPEVAIDRDFLATRIESALALRRRLFAEPFYRLIHAEADGLPGLIVDRYDDVLVCQINSAGMELLSSDLLAALDRVLSPAAIVLRNDGALRQLEGLESYVRVAKGAIEGPVTLVENGARFQADLLGGQKTGWFFDQRDNRGFMARLANSGRVIDLYSYIGGFAIQAACAGAAEVIAVARSRVALDLATESAALNAVEARCRFVRAPVFDEIERRAAAGERFETVIADPPAFVKSRKDLKAGIKGYRKLTRMAAALVAPGGYLFLASCSHNVDTGMFAEQVRHGLADARRTGRILRSVGAAPDHPVHPFLPESAYLKAQILQLD